MHLAIAEVPSVVKDACPMPFVISKDSLAKYLSTGVVSTLPMDVVVNKVTLVVASIDIIEDTGPMSLVIYKLTNVSVPVCKLLSALAMLLALE